jgi:hypothetical protein
MNEDHKLIASDGVGGDGFGSSVSLSSDIALIGADFDDDHGYASGSAYIFRNNGVTWVEEQKLLPSDGEEWDRFGRYVSVSGDVVLIGAEGDDDLGQSSGSAYIFRYNGMSWVQEAKLIASDGAEYDYFGNSVSVSGDVALIGARGDDDSGDHSGSAYVFRYNGVSWVEEAKLLASDGAASDDFGSSLSISGDVALIGAWKDDDLGNRSGSAYIYRYDVVSWMEEAKLLASDGAAEEWFGRSVSVSGDVALIGVYKDDDLGYASGSAYVFRNKGVSWIEETKFLAPDGEANDNFGRSVSVSGDVVLIGADMDDDMGNQSGSAWVFRYNGMSWVEEAKLLASDGETEDNFGFSVSVFDDVALVGANRGEGLGSNCGSAYVLDLSGGSIDLTLSRTGPVTIPRGSTLFFRTQIENKAENPISGNFWLSILLPNMNELLDNELYIPSVAPTGWYTLIGRIGSYPNTAIDVSSFPFQVTY